MTELRVIEAVEYVPLELARDGLTVEEGTALWERYRDQLDIEFPTPLTGGRWRLTPRSWVGHMPVTPDLCVAVRPKVDVRSVFAMLEYAYDLRSFKLFDGVQAAGALDEVYERIASIFAQRVRTRVRRGVHRAYQADQDRLPYLRGRLDTLRLAAAPWRVDLDCCFEEHTPDIEDNQLLLWALHVCARSGICRALTARRVMDAHRALAGTVSLVEREAGDYRGRRYHRLNEDYEPLHALARFLVDHSGPTHTRGAHAMVPFLVDMNRLFERFVAAWLECHLPHEWLLDRQGHLSFGTTDKVEFRADLVIRDRQTQRAIAVLDTKYKRDTTPSADDVAQVVAYATAWGTTDAVLVYPQASGAPWIATVGKVRVGALAFSLDGDLDAAGRRLLEALKGSSGQG